MSRNAYGNTILGRARSTSDTDEWYTPMEIIEEEVSHYSEQFSGKVVLCNCDDPYESNFTRYFMRYFNVLGLKRLICTSYASPRVTTLNGYVQLSLEDESGEPIIPYTGLVLSISKIPGAPGRIVEDATIDKILHKRGTVKSLHGSGRFQSSECVKYLKKCDICCTNPPFSQFIDLFDLLIKHGKKFLLISNQNVVTFKNVFPYIKEDKVRCGYRFGDMPFRVPHDTEPRKTRFWIDKDGQKWRSLGNAIWLTNLQNERMTEPLKLTSKYDPAVYPKYDGHDAINVNAISEIPMDYYGVMGVPITFLKYYNSAQFEIVGVASHGKDSEYDLFEPEVDGKKIFKRILIKRK